MSKQPKALVLADQLKERFGATVPTSQAAAELRRLHELNAELVEALTAVTRRGSILPRDLELRVYAVLAKAEAA